MPRGMTGRTIRPSRTFPRPAHTPTTNLAGMHTTNSAWTPTLHRLFADWLDRYGFPLAAARERATAEAMMRPMTEHTVTICVRHGHGRIEAQSLDEHGTQLAEAAGYSLGHALGRIGDALTQRLGITTTEGDAQR